MTSKLQNYQEPNRKNNQNPIISDIIESYENHVQIEKEKKRKLYQLILNYKQNPLEQEQLEKSKQKTTQEIEKKFQKSQANKQFVFPRTINENDVLDSDFSDISSDFKDVTLYDLFSQNKKNEIILQKQKNINNNGNNYYLNQIIKNKNKQVLNNISNKSPFQPKNRQKKQFQYNQNQQQSQQNIQNSLSPKQNLEKSYNIYSVCKVDNDNINGSYQNQQYAYKQNDEYSIFSKENNVTGSYRISNNNLSSTILSGNKKIAQTNKSPFYKNHVITNGNNLNITGNKNLKDLGQSNKQIKNQKQLNGANSVSINRQLKQISLEKTISNQFYQNYSLSKKNNNISSMSKNQSYQNLPHSYQNVKKNLSINTQNKYKESNSKQTNKYYLVQQNYIKTEGNDVSHKQSSKDNSKSQLNFNNSLINLTQQSYYDQGGSNKQIQQQNQLTNYSNFQSQKQILNQLQLNSSKNNSTIQNINNNQTSQQSIKQNSNTQSQNFYNSIYSQIKNENNNNKGRQLLKKKSSNSNIKNGVQSQISKLNSKLSNIGNCNIQSSNINIQNEQSNQKANQNSQPIRSFINMQNYKNGNNVINGVQNKSVNNIEQVQNQKKSIQNHNIVNQNSINNESPSLYLNAINKNNSTNSNQIESANQLNIPGQNTNLDYSNMPLDLTNNTNINMQDQKQKDKFSKFQQNFNYSYEALSSNNNTSNNNNLQQSQSSNYLNLYQKSQNQLIIKQQQQENQQNQQNFQQQQKNIELKKKFHLPTQQNLQQQQQQNHQQNLLTAQMYSSLDDIKKNRPYNQQSLQKLNTLQSPSMNGPFINYDKSASNQQNRVINNINNMEGNSKGPHFQQNGNIQSSYQIGIDQKNFLENSVSQFQGQSQIKSPTKKPKNQSMIQSYLNNMSATSSKLQKNKPLTKKEIQKKKDEEKNQINKLKLQQTSALNIPEQHTKKLNNIMNNIMNKVIVTNSNGIKNNIYQKNFEHKTDKKKEKQPLTSEQFQQLEQKLKQFANQMSKK